MTLDHSGLLGCDTLVGLIFSDVYKVLIAFILKKDAAKYRGRCRTYVLSKRREY